MGGGAQPGTALLQQLLQRPLPLLAQLLLGLGVPVRQLLYLPARGRAGVGHVMGGGAAPPSGKWERNE